MTRKSITFVEFKVAGVWLQLEEGTTNKTDWTFRVGISDIVREHNRLRELGIESTDVKTVPNVISYLNFKDLDGNNLSFYQLLQ